MQRPGTAVDGCCLSDPAWTPDEAAIVYLFNESVFRLPVDRDPLRFRDPELIRQVPGLSGVSVFPDGRLLLRIAEGARTGEAGQDGTEDTEPDRYFLVVNWKTEFLRKLDELGG